MRLIPPPPDLEPTDTAESYGLQLLAYVVRERTAVLLSDPQIALALHVAPIASAVQVQIGADRIRRVEYRTAAADAIAEAKRELLSCQRIRVQLAAETTPETAQPPAGSPSSRSGGSLVPRQPIAPTQPPAGQYADLKF